MVGPWYLITETETNLSSGLTGLLVATVPTGTAIGSPMPAYLWCYLARILLAESQLALSPPSANIRPWIQEEYFALLEALPSPR